MTTKQHRQIFAILNRADVSRDERIDVYRSIVCRADITSTNDLTPSELESVAGCLYSWDAAGHLDAVIADILSDRAKA